MKKENRIKGQGTTTTDRSEDFYKKMYGENVVITRLGRISIVHLDHPSPQTIEKRIQEVLREEITGEAWEDDCPLCQATRTLPHDVVYNGDS